MKAFKTLAVGSLSHVHVSQNRKYNLTRTFKMVWPCEIFKLQNIMLVSYFFLCTSCQHPLPKDPDNGGYSAGTQNDDGTVWAGTILTDIYTALIWYSGIGSFLIDVLIRKHAEPKTWTKLTLWIIRLVNSLFVLFQPRRNWMWMMCVKLVDLYHFEGDKSGVYY